MKPFEDELLKVNIQTFFAFNLYQSIISMLWQVKVYTCITEGVKYLS